MTKVVLGFPCVGKTTYVRNVTSAEGKVVSYTENEFDINVVMKNVLDGVETVLPYSDHIVKELQENGVHFYMVYPEAGECKSDYLAHLVRSGRRMPVVHSILKDWDKVLEEIESLKGCTHIKLGRGQYLTDKLWENSNG